jgi:hypothetical protein
MGSKWKFVGVVGMEWPHLCCFGFLGIKSDF